MQFDAYMRASERLYNQFPDGAGRIIPMDNDTRYSMSSVACELVN